MGNAFLRDGQLNTKENANLQNLREKFQTIDWLSSYSDIVALMVLEHQTQMHNTFTRANFTVRQAQYDSQLSSTEGGQPLDDAEFNAVVATAAREVVDYMLFVDEAPLTSEVKGSIIFKGQFRHRGPDDGKGRCLREFDLKARLFRYPCSYLIYSSAFDSMEQPLRHEIYSQLWAALSSTASQSRFAHLDQGTRETITEILRETKPELVGVWDKLHLVSLPEGVK